MDNVEPTIAASTTRGARICHTMDQSVAVKPLSTEKNGKRSNNSSGTRHHVGPAGPIIKPSNNEHASATTAAGIHHWRVPRTLIEVDISGYYLFAAAIAAANCSTKSTTRGPQREATSSSSSTM